MDAEQAREELERLRARVRLLEAIVAGQPATSSPPPSAAFGLEAREKLLSEAEQLAHMGSFVWEAATDTSHWSDELHRIFGLDPGSVAPSLRMFLAAIDPRDRPRIEEAAQRAIATGVSKAEDFRIVRPDGSIRHVHMTGVALVDATGRPERFVGAVLDVTERVQLEAQLLHARKMEALGRLAGGMAHDFNNLLTVIGMHVALLRRQREGIELAEVAAAVERAAEITRQLLAFGRQSVFDPRRIDPAPVVRDALAMARRIVGEHVAVSLTSASEVGRIELDPAQLGQVLMHLVVNASDALRPGGHIDVTLRAETIDESPEGAQPPLTPGEYVVLAVADDGVGIDAAVQRRLFEPFVTTKGEGDDATTRSIGLGLPLVFGVVSAARGAIVVQTAEDRGTTVLVYLPRVVTTTPPPAAVEPPQAGRRVLLVEDNGAIRRVLTTILAEAGFDVEPAADGDEAVALYQARPGEFAAVVTDVVMPKMGGPQMVRLLRSITPGLPVLYLSGYARERAGVDDEATRGTLLKKPFLPAELVERVSAMVAGRPPSVPPVDDDGC